MSEKTIDPLTPILSETWDAERELPLPDIGEDSGR